VGKDEQGINPKIRKYASERLEKDDKRFKQNVVSRGVFSKSIYGRIKVPVMIVLGDRDGIMTEHGLEMHRLIRGSQFCVLPNTSHEVFTKRPNLINTIAMDFFSK